MGIIVVASLAFFAFASPEATLTAPAPTQAPSLYSVLENQGGFFALGMIYYPLIAKFIAAFEKFATALADGKLFQCEGISD